MRPVKKKKETRFGGFSLNTDIIADIFRLAKPLGHFEKPENSNLGFGFLYYGAVRTLRPDHVLVIGSGFGFSVVCLALGLKDNGKGGLSFVDPSYDVLKHGPLKTMGGRGMWRDPDGVKKHFGLLGVEAFITHYKMVNRDFFPSYGSMGLPRVDLAFIDGNHSFENVQYDFIETLRHSGKNTYIFLHDTNIYIREMIRNAGVKKLLSRLRKERDLFELLDFPFSSGVAIVRVLRDHAWRCMDCYSL